MDGRVKDFVRESKHSLNERKDELENFEKEVKDYLEKNLLKDMLLKNVSIHTRIKDPDSLGEKIIRSKVLLFDEISPSLYIQKLKDIIGVRLVCLLNIDEEKLYEEILKKFNKKSDIEEYSMLEEVDQNKGFLVIDHTNQPVVQKNGNDIYKMECLWCENDQIIPVELQIKSLVHMFWGELEHKLIYKNYTYDDQQGFYKDIMSSINELLSNIDNQLSTINSHLANKNEKEQKLRAKEMLTNEFYINLQKKLNLLIIDYDLDFREVYILLTQILSDGKKHNKIIDLIATLMPKLSALSLSEENFSFKPEELQVNTVENLKPLGNIIANLILSVDVVWRVLFGLYHILEENESAKTSFKGFIDKLNSRFETVISEKISEAYEVVEEDFCNRILFPAVSAGVIEAFGKYLKMDFFIERKNLELILESSEEFITFLINHYDNIIDLDKCKSNRELVPLLSQKLKLQILINISAHVEKKELNELIINLQNFSDWTFELDFKAMEELIKGKLTAENREKLIQTLNTKKEGESQNDQD